MDGLQRFYIKVKESLSLYHFITKFVLTTVIEHVTSVHAKMITTLEICLLNHPLPLHFCLLNHPCPLHFCLLNHPSPSFKGGEFGGDIGGELGGELRGFRGSLKIC